MMVSIGRHLNKLVFTRDVPVPFFLSCDLCSTFHVVEFGVHKCR
jgi:hypothetical protein